MTKKTLASMLTKAGFPTNPNNFWFNRSALSSDSVPFLGGRTNDGIPIYSYYTLKELGARKRNGYTIKINVEKQYYDIQIWIWWEE